MQGVARKRKVCWPFWAKSTGVEEEQERRSRREGGEEEQERMQEESRHARWPEGD